MRGLSAAEILAVWERGKGKPPVQQAFELFSAAFPEQSRQGLALRSVGQRDASLLDLREATLGSELQGMVNCPSCGENLEFSFSASDVRAQCDHELLEEFDVVFGEFHLRVRSPNSVDLAATSEPELERARDDLFRRCLISAKQGGRTVDALPDEVVQAVGVRMAKANSHASARLVISCETCGREQAVIFDVASFFWAEVDACALRLLGEVHEMASRYGWTEREILSLSPLRRQSYLEMVRS